MLGEIAVHLKRHIDFRCAYRTGIVGLIDDMSLSVESDGHKDRLTGVPLELPGQMMPDIGGGNSAGDRSGAPGGIGGVPYIPRPSPLILHWVPKMNFFDPFD
jgi:hypothetical protein